MLPMISSVEHHELVVAYNEAVYEIIEEYYEMDPNGAERLASNMVAYCFKQRLQPGDLLFYDVEVCIRLVAKHRCPMERK